LLVASSLDGEARIWNVATGQEMVVIQNAPKAMFEEHANTIVIYCCQNSIGLKCIPIPILTEIDRMEMLRSAAGVHD